MCTKGHFGLNENQDGGIEVVRARLSGKGTLERQGEIELASKHQSHATNLREEGEKFWRLRVSLNHSTKLFKYKLQSLLEAATKRNH